MAKNSVKTLSGQTVVNVHDKSLCTPPCIFHSPSDHHMVSWKLQSRRDRAFNFKGSYLLLFERICEHGVGHPDPDSVAWLESVYPNAWGIHGCCGCCLKDRSQ